jgi:hypothetical protein
VQLRILWRAVTQNFMFYFCDVFGPNVGPTLAVLPRTCLGASLNKQTNKQTDRHEPETKIFIYYYLIIIIILLLLLSNYYLCQELTAGRNST